MRFVARAPRPPLDALVSLVWFARRADAPRFETVLPSGRAQLVIQLDGRPNRWSDRRGHHRASGALLGGPFVAPVGLPGASQVGVAGVLFHPGGLAAMLDVPVDVLQGSYVPVRELWGTEADRWIESVRTARSPQGALRALENALMMHVRRPSRRRALELACRALANGQGVRAVAASLGASQRRFSRTFTDDVGMTPKQFTRLARFQRALAAIRSDPSRDLTAVGLDAGFYDQAHFVREFRAFGGLTPSAYRAALGPYVHHVTEVE